MNHNIANARRASILKQAPILHRQGSDQLFDDINSDKLGSGRFDQVINHVLRADPVEENKERNALQDVIYPQRQSHSRWSRDLTTNGLVPPLIDPGTGGNNLRVSSHISSSNQNSR